MINVLNYYKENITEDDYYYKYYDELITCPEKEDKEFEEIFKTKRYDIREFVFLIMKRLFKSLNRYAIQILT